MRITGRKKKCVGVVWYKERDVCARQADLIVFAFLICGDSFIISKTPIFYFFKSISEELKNQSIMMLDSSELYAIYIEERQYCQTLNEHLLKKARALE